ncbi:hypothetical protein D3C71_1832840 [compost metagenome]
MYRKCGVRESSFPFLLRTASWNCNIKNIPNALDCIIPRSPFLEHAVTTLPSAKAFSNSNILVLPHRAFLRPGCLSRLLSCVIAPYRNFSVSFLPLPLVPGIS